MDNKELKTSVKQRLVIGFIAFLLLFSTVAIYALIVLNGENSNNVASEEKLSELEVEMQQKYAELTRISTEMSDKYFPEVQSYKNDYVKGYNATSVNNAGLHTVDIVEGNGKEITDSSDYYAYYIGWCADESIFDSSFNDNTNPSALKEPLQFEAKSSQFIAGWTEGVIGMKVGGAREIDIPGELAYGDTQEICGGKNSPLKFIVKLVDQPSEEYPKLVEEYNKLYYKWYTMYTQLQNKQAKSTPAAQTSTENAGTDNSTVTTAE